MRSVWLVCGLVAASTWTASGAAGSGGTAANQGATGQVTASLPAPGQVSPSQVVPGQAAADQELSAFREAIRAKYDLKEKAFAAHDANTIVTRFYTADVVSVGEGEGVFIGREQIRPLYEDVVRNNKVKVESIQTFVKGDAGWDWADFHVYPTDGKTRPFTFAILFLWTRIHGEWMCKGDFFVKGSFKDRKLPVAPESQ